MKISLIQMNSGQDKAANIAAAAALRRTSRGRGAAQWWSAGMFRFSRGHRADKQEAAEILGDGLAYRAMQDLARGHRIFFTPLILEKIPGETRLHNSTVVFDRDGDEIAAIARFICSTSPRRTVPNIAKALPSSRARRSRPTRPRLSLSAAPSATILRFPYLFAALADKGADVIVLPAAFTLATGKDHWEVLCRARAIETETYFRPR